MLELPFALPRLTAVIGGGGKTTLLFALGRSAAARGAAVLLTTTTHLAWPPPEGAAFCAPETAEDLRRAAAPGRAVLAGHPCGDRRMTGLSPGLLAEACRSFDCVICEADGSRGRPLKWHGADEPCVPPGTELLIQVAGLSALGRPADEAVHRWEQAGYRAGQKVTEEDVLRLVRRGFACAGAGRAVCLLNQADVLPEPGPGGRIARALAAEGVPCGLCVLKEERMLCWY